MCLLYPNCATTRTLHIPLPLCDNCSSLRIRTTTCAAPHDPIYLRSHNSFVLIVLLSTLGRRPGATQFRPGLAHHDACSTHACKCLFGERKRGTLQLRILTPYSNTTAGVCPTGKIGLTTSTPLPEKGTIMRDGSSPQLDAVGTLAYQPELSLL